MTVAACPPIDQLHALSLGQLPETQSDLLFTHLQDCESCRGEMDTLSDIEDSLVTALREPVEPNAYETEGGCQSAAAKALGALAGWNYPDSSLSLPLPRKIGEYELVRPLGRGGMGTVFLAQHTKLGRQVAVKLLADHRLGDPRMKERFEAEMRAVGQLSHPNIVTAHDAREVDGTAVLVTEFIHGFDLGQIVQRLGKLSVANACEIIRQVAVALEYTGQQGFVHRDVKPSNIMLSFDGEVKLLDLGLARLSKAPTVPMDGVHSSENTIAGQVVGTADYVAPEQVNDSRSVDVRADIYALGCTLFKLLTGEAPFANLIPQSAISKLQAHVSEVPPRLRDQLPDVPPALDQLVDSMMSKSPGARPQTPISVAEKLGAWSSGHDLRQLVVAASSADEVSSAGESLAESNQPQPAGFFQHRIPGWVAMACCIMGLVLGLSLGIIITIVNPDGTRTEIRTADGAQVEIGDASAISETSTHAALDADRLSLVVLVNPDSERAPNVSPSKRERLRDALQRRPSNEIVAEQQTRWYPIAKDLEVPIDAWNNGTRYTLGATDPEHYVSWQEILDNVTKVHVNERSETPELHIEFKPPLGEKLRRLSTANKRNRLAIVIDGKIFSAPYITDTIGARVALTGNYTLEQLNELKSVLERGQNNPVPQPPTSATTFSPLAIASLCMELPKEQLSSATVELGNLFADSPNSKRFETAYGVWHLISPSCTAPVTIQIGSDTFALLTSEPGGVVGWDKLFAETAANFRPAKSGKVAVQLGFSPRLAASMSQLTRQRVRQRLAIILDDQIVSTPMILSEKSTQIDLRLSGAQAEFLGAWLNGNPTDKLPGLPQYRRNPPNASTSTQPLRGVWEIDSLSDGGQTAVRDAATPTAILMQGEWAAFVYGEPAAEDMKLGRFEVAGEKLVFERDGQITRGIFRFLQRDELEVCLNENGTEIPTAFESKPNSPNDLLIKLRRVSIPTSETERTRWTERPFNAFVWKAYQSFQEQIAQNASPKLDGQTVN